MAGQFILCLMSVLLTTIYGFPSISTSANYEGYQVYQVSPESEEHLQIIKQWANDPDFDFWEETDRVGRHATIMVPPKKLQELHASFAKNNFPHQLKNENVQRSIDAERIEVEELAQKSGKSFNYDSYNRYESIIDEMGEMVKRCPVGFTCETYDIGSSVNSLPLKVLKISKEGANRKGVWMDSLIHAREWIAGATVLKIMDNFLSNYGSDPETTALLDDYNWYFLPVMNPDGYIWSWDGYRLWRKNMRAPHPDDIINQCYGADLNRNYDSYWMNDGTSDYECLDNFGGPSAASEPETQAVQAEALRIGANLIAWVSVHSFSSLWLTPWGNTYYNEDQGAYLCDDATDYPDLLRVGGAAARATGETYGTTVWEYGSCCNVLYAASGATMDFVKAKAGVKYTFTPELRGTSFIISPSEVPLSFQEVWNGVKAMVTAIEETEEMKK